MIPVEYYTTVYYTVLSICIVFMVIPILKYANLQQFSKSILNFNSIVLLIIVICFIGFRDPWGSWRYFGDTGSYTRIYESLKMGNDFIAIKDSGFYFFMKFAGKLLSIQFFYILCALLYVIPPFLAFKKWFGKNAFFALAIFVVSMSFWGFGINGVRNGLATSLLLYAFSLQGQKVKMIVFMLLAISFHKSVLLPIVAYFIAYNYTNTKVLIRLWFFMVLFSYFFGDSIEVFVQNFISFTNFADTRRTQNLFANELEGQLMERRYRLDFILYSTFPIFMGYLYTVKKKVSNVFYSQLLNIYIISNTVWVFLIYAAYTNRVAYLSWFLLPVILIYPLLKYKLFKKQNKLIAYLIFGSLLLTVLLYNK